MAFINFIPRDKKYIDDHEYVIGDAIPLRVVQDDGVKMTPDVNIKVTDLSDGKKQFVDASGKGDRFVFTVLISEDDEYTGTWTEKFGPCYSQVGPNGAVKIIDHFDYPTSLKVSELLDWCIRNMVVVLVTSDGDTALIPRGNYIITDNRNRVQNFKNGYSLWELEFTTYTGEVLSSFENIADQAKKAIAAYTKKKTAAKKKAAEKIKESNDLNAKLKKCKGDQMKYSKTKKVTECTKTLQTWLNKHKFGNLKIDGWYGDSTMKAVKKFQEKYKKKYKLTANGKMNRDTMAAMLKV